jgi:NADP-dependent 3-hydroxy acid dehydrogenase YdfG
LHPNVNACFTPGLSGDARQSEAGSAWEIAPLEERNVAEMSCEVDVFFKGVLNGIRIMLAGMNAPRSGSASARLSVMPTTSSFA